MFSGEEVPVDMDAPNNNVFVGDLPPNMDEETLKQIFGQYASVASVRLLPTQQKGGELKSAMLIRFDSIEGAQWVKENLNGAIPEGLQSPVFVNYNNRRSKGKGKDFAKGCSPYGGNNANPLVSVLPGAASSMFSGSKAGSSSWGKSKGNGKHGITNLKKGLLEAQALPAGTWVKDSNSLYVKGLPPDTTDLDLYHIFSGFGAIPAFGCRAMVHDDGSCKGFGFVNFTDSTAVASAIMTLDGTPLGDGSFLSVTVKAGATSSQGINTAAGGEQPVSVHTEQNKIIIHCAGKGTNTAAVQWADTPAGPEASWSNAY